MNDTTTINMFNGDNTNIAYTNAQHFQTLAYMVLKIKKPIVANHTVFPVFLLARSIPSLISILAQYSICNI